LVPAFPIDVLCISFAAPFAVLALPFATVGEGGERAKALLIYK
jgi:uncharacterized RDD family membrane protein YckC